MAYLQAEQPLDMYNVLQAIEPSRESYELPKRFAMRKGGWYRLQSSG